MFFGAALRRDHLEIGGDVLVPQPLPHVGKLLDVLLADDRADAHEPVR